MSVEANIPAVDAADRFGLASVVATRRKHMPIRLMTAVGVAAGLTDSELKSRRHVVSVDPVIEKLSV